MTLWRYTNLFIIVIIFFTPVLNSQGRKNYAVQYKKVQKSSWNEPYSSLLPQYSRLISTTHFLDNLVGLCFEPFSFLDMPGFL